MKSDSAKTTQSGLRAALLQRGFAVSDALWTRLLGGRTNQSWKVEAGGLSLVVKLFGKGSDNPLFPNDASAEVASLRYLDSLNLAPRWLDDFALAEGHCVIYDHVPGQTWQTGVAEIATLLHRVHGMGGPVHLRAVPDGSDALLRQTEDILSRCPPGKAKFFMSLRPSGVIAPLGRSCFLHGDPVPGNIVGHPGDWRLIDWQCPAYGDPCEDIALFLSPAMQMAYRGTSLSESERQRFLAAYPEQGIIRRYQSLAAFYHWRMAAYCLWLDSRGDAAAAEGAEAEIAAMSTALS
ncbi:phosphotransferase [Roseovarius mucosus]|uniref:phosphotransferase n=1 Tax=Roseovarius mucosus TaxID=215743 RepID=UPI0035D0DC70